MPTTWTEGSKAGPTYVEVDKPYGVYYVLIGGVIIPIDEGIFTECTAASPTYAEDSVVSTAWTEASS